jgi:Uma2 family endonuclease
VGDTILLVTGGHGFEVLEEVEMIEVKQGPYVSDRDKTRFQGIPTEQAKLPRYNGHSIALQSTHFMVTALQSQPPSQSYAPSIVLQGISWQTYQSLVRELESQPGKRLTYDNGNLEICMPLPSHEIYKRRLGRLVEIVTEEMEMDIFSLSASTWSREDLLKGVEADECYYIQNEAAVRSKLNINLAVDPPPDLAIEVDITSPSLPRLPIYAALGVQEVWQFDGEQVTLLRLSEGNYVAINRSVALPILPQEVIQHWLVQAQSMGETSWARAFRRWVREQF